MTTLQQMEFEFYMHTPIRQLPEDLVDYLRKAARRYKKMNRRVISKCVRKYVCEGVR